MTLPPKTLTSAEDVEAWLAEVRETLLKHINADRPVVIK